MIANDSKQVNDPHDHKTNDYKLGHFQMVLKNYPKQMITNDSKQENSQMILNK